MARCTRCGSRFFGNFGENGHCSACHGGWLRDQAVERLAAEPIHAPNPHDPDGALRGIILTTETAHNLPVTERLGIIAAEVVIGMHIFRDIGAAFRDVFGGRSQTMQRGLKDAREAALAELRLEAAQLGADAVVGIDLDYSEISGGGKSMLFLVASGTAVKLA